jgi:hypothetical protein
MTGMSNGVEAAISSGMYVVNAIDKRADNLATEKVVSEAASVDRCNSSRTPISNAEIVPQLLNKGFSSYISASRLCGTYIPILYVLNSPVNSSFISLSFEL